MKRNFDYSQYRLETLCKLDDGRIVPYDAAASELWQYSPAVFEYLGKGKIHSIGGVNQNFDKEEYFYVKRK